MDKDILFFLIGVIVTLTCIWLIGAFITWDLLWFISSLVGRFIAVTLFLATVFANIRASDI